jgi:branched-subunit amino acid ABC-type transport system permease component
MKLIKKLNEDFNQGIDRFTNVAAKIASVFSVIFAMSIVYEFRNHIDFWLVGVLSIFIAFFLIVNEVIKVRSIKNVHNGNNKALFSFIFTFVISIALSGTGIYLWVNKTQDINSKSLIDKTVKVNDIKAESSNELEKINSNTYEDSKQF